jgi:hypothetical protein
MSAIGLAVGDTKKNKRGIVVSFESVGDFCLVFFFFPHEHDYYFEQEFLN